MQYYIGSHKFIGLEILSHIDYRNISKCHIGATLATTAGNSLKDNKLMHLWCKFHLYSLKIK